jgi:hypothetical protein
MLIFSKKNKKNIYDISDVLTYIARYSIQTGICEIPENPLQGLVDG